ncbi:MAG TPA: aldehyde dehydrogenase family protein [Candidatus Paceibacterota bacterium]
MIEIHNPYTQKSVGAIEETDINEIERVLKTAHSQKYALAANERAGVLQRTANLLQANKEKYARTITDESGLCLKDTLYEIDRVTSAARYAAIVAEKIEHDTTPEYILDDKQDPKLTVITEPLDLAVGITPFNHPMNQVAHKVFPAVAAGTPIIIKPSEKTPLSAILLKNILEEAGLPKNLFIIVINKDIEKLVGMLVTSALVDIVSFTGSYDVGNKIAKMTGLKKFIPELGGSSAFIINDDTDLELAAKLAVKGCFGNSGQRCTAIRRIIVLKNIADEFIKKFVANTEKIKYGDPYDQATDMGTVINEEAATRIQDRVEKAVRDGAKLLYGHKRTGALYSPTILDNVSVSSELVSCETFGPVAPIIRAKDLDEAIQIAKNTNYALAGAIATKSRDKAKRVADTLVVGQFSWNGIPGYRTEAAPFGGFKHSGNGEKEGIVLATRAMRRIRTFYEH